MNIWESQYANKRTAQLIRDLLCRQRRDKTTRKEKKSQKNIDCSRVGRSLNGIYKKRVTMRKFSHDIFFANSKFVIRSILQIFLRF